MSRFTLIKSVSDKQRLYKTFTSKDGVIEQLPRSMARMFYAEYRDFSGFDQMVELLSQIEAEGNTAIVRGDISYELEMHAKSGLPIQRTKRIRSDNKPPGFQQANRDWMMIDIDKYHIPPEEWELYDPAKHPDSTVQYIISKLPAYLHDTSCWWQYSASQNVLAGGTTISLHLFYLLDRPVEDNVLRLWAESHRANIGDVAQIDPAVFDCIQPHYIAPPCFVGLEDPLPHRSGVFHGSKSYVVFDVPAAAEYPYSPDEKPVSNVTALIQMRKLKPYLDAIGDDPGKAGFNNAIKSVIGKYFSLYGPEAIDIPLKTALRKAISEAPARNDRPLSGIGSPAHYASDDWLDPLIRNIREAEAESKSVKQGAFEMALERYLYVEEMERFLDTSTLTFRSKSGVTDTHANETKQLAEILLNSTKLRRVSRITYKPGAPEICLDFDPDTGKEFRAYNRYIPPKITLQDPKDAAWFVEHINYLCDDDETAANAILDWLATLIQFPDEKINFGVLLQGSQGTGKSLVGRVMSKILGASNVTNTVTPQILVSQFTEWMVGKQLIIVEEIRDKEDKFRIYEQMKTLITGETIRVNPKGLPSYVIPNRANFLCFTNHEDAVPMDEDDRRFIIHFSQAVPRDADYYTDLINKIDLYSGAVYNYLLQRDLTDFNHLGRAPMTDSKKDYMTMSGAPLYRWIKECIEGEIFPFGCDLITLRDLQVSLPHSFRRSGDSILTINLRKAGAVRLNSQKKLPHGKMYVWAVRNKDRWLYASDEVICNEYERPISDGSGSGFYQKPSAPSKKRSY